MPSSFSDPRENVSRNAGIGEYGNDFNITDPRFQVIRMKIPGVLSGRDRLTMDEVQFLLCKLFQGV